MDGVTHVPLDYEVVIQRVYEAIVRPGDVVLDVGAHLGLHTIPLARLVAPSGVVHAFEPLPSCRRRLADALGDLAPLVHLHDCALGAAEGVAEFVVAVDRLPESGLRPREYERRTRLERFPVRVRTLDGLLPDLPLLRFLKLDAEGGELDILRGAEATLRRHRPVLAFECGLSALGQYEATPAALFDFLAGLGYRVHGIDGTHLDGAAFEASAEQQAIHDYVAVPDEDAEASRAVEGAFNSGRFHCLVARAALTTAEHYSGLVGEVPPLVRYPAWVRPLARRAARLLLYFSRVFLVPQKWYQGAVLATLDPLVTALGEMERDLLASQRRIRELESRLDEIERRQRPAA